MTKNDLKRGYKFTETFEGKVNVLIAVDGTFEGEEHYGKQEFLVAFNQIPTEDEITLWVCNNIFMYCLSDDRWTDLTYKYHILPKMDKQIKLK